MPGPYEISFDRDRLQVDVIHGFLRESYWAKEIPRATVETAIRNSLCVAVYDTSTPRASLVGFARVLTDYVSLAYLADVFVLPEHRHHGLGSAMVRAILDHPELQGVRRFLLATLDAHALYARAGFEPLARPQDFMTLRRVTSYSATQSPSEKSVGILFSRKGADGEARGGRIPESGL